MVITGIERDIVVGTECSCRQRKFEPQPHCADHISLTSTTSELVSLSWGQYIADHFGWKYTDVQRKDPRQRISTELTVDQAATSAHSGQERFKTIDGR